MATDRDALISLFLRGGHTTLPLYSWVQAASHTSNVPLTYALSTIIMLISLALTIFSIRILLAGRE